MKSTSKVVGLILVIFVLAAMTGCKGEKKAEEIRLVMEKNLKIMEDFIGTVEETEETRVYISALQKLKKDFQNLIPEMKGLSEKYPGLFDLDENRNPDPELKDILKEMLEREAQVRPKFVDALKKVMTSGDDPEIKKALQEIFELQKKFSG